MYQVIRYRVDVLGKLKEAGYSAYSLRKNGIFNEMQIQGFRDGKILPFKQIDKVCKLLRCDVGDVLQYVEDDTQPAQPAPCDPA